MSDINVAFISEFAYKYRWPFLILLSSICVVGIGVLSSLSFHQDKVEVLSASDQSQTQQQVVDKIVVEIAGAVKTPGVYDLPINSRIDDLIKIAGGLENENSDWVERFINRAAVLTDGQKIYIPSKEEQSGAQSDNNSNGSQNNNSRLGDHININTASQSDLESLSGIGPVYAQSIIDHRPYSSTDELIDKDVIKQSTYQKIKDQLTVF